MSRPPDKHTPEILRRLVTPPPGFEPFDLEDTQGSIPARFHKMVAAHAALPATSADGVELTYAELDRLANRIANRVLDRLGPGEEPVALLLPNDNRAMAALIGVLKAGKAYLPLDPAYPRDRITYILEDSNTRLMLAGRPVLSFSREVCPPGCAVIDFDDAAQAKEDDPSLEIPPERAASFMYTSGSTGSPKGVVLPHRFVLHNMMRYTNCYGIGPGDRMTLLQSISFSGAQGNTLGVFLNGACTCLYDVRSRGAAALAQWVRAERITIFCTVPTVFRALGAALGPDETFPAVRLVRLSGEPVTEAEFDIYRRHFNDKCLLAIAYGATECGLDTTCFFDRHGTFDSAAMPIGYECEGAQILILDDELRPVPEGEAGEILVRSRYLARGYHGRPELTSKVFLPAGEGVRMYRTGDLGRRLPDGCFVHLGRRDFQVKIRGQRIETGEVESALRALASVKEAAVAARPDHTGEMRLVAYVVPAGPAPTVSSLRRDLSTRLTEAMVPSSFVFLDRLPLTPVGKLDRRALPEPLRSRPLLDNAFEQPQTPVEKALSALWEDVLGIEGIGRQDDFLELGGNSLLATRLLAQVADAFRVQLGLESFFRCPTVAAQSEFVAAALLEQFGESDFKRILAETQQAGDDD